MTSLVDDLRRESSRLRRRGRLDASSEVERAHDVRLISLLDVAAERIESLESLVQSVETIEGLSDDGHTASRAAKASAGRVA